MSANVEHILAHPLLIALIFQECIVASVLQALNLMNIQCKNIWKLPAPMLNFKKHSSPLRRCEDIDECIKFSGHACSLQADCVNSIGSYQCICKPGFSLAADNRSCDGYQLGIDEATCEDIDECKIWAKSGNELCMGKCINTPGSFLCTCPEGYQVMSDGITCKDIDECSENSNLCNIDQICINLLGSFKCERIDVHVIISLTRLLKSKMHSF
ncbi:unnamed protein product [Meloidogyne enterolobii]|uniref:Uncharacterized protein n=1 Tax=Meloidogyne enterolobii TaxID=390850 RepID=A0ACB0Y4Y6_MELEN